MTRPFKYMQSLHDIVCEGKVAQFTNDEIIVLDTVLFCTQISKSRSWNNVQRNLNLYGFRNHKVDDNHWVIRHPDVHVVHDILSVKKPGELAPGETPANFYMFKLHELVKKGDIAYLKSKKIIIPDIDVFLCFFKLGLEFSSFRRQMHYHSFSTRRDGDKVTLGHKKLKTVDAILTIENKKKKKRKNKKI